MTDPAPEARLEVYRTRSLRRSQRWAWRLVAANGRIIARSSEGYSHRYHAVRVGSDVCSGGQPGTLYVWSSKSLIGKQRWVWTFADKASGKVLANGGEGYARYAEAFGRGNAVTKGNYHFVVATSE